MAGEKRSGTFLDDAESLRALIDMMPAGEKATYGDYKSLSMEAAFPNRKLVVYTLLGGKATDVQTITLGDIFVDRLRGPRVGIEWTGGHAEITTVPQRFLHRDLFLQVPQHFELKWKGKQTPRDEVHFVPHYAVLVKTRSRESLQIDGHTYCVTLNKFRERHPNVPIEY